MYRENPFFKIWKKKNQDYPMSTLYTNEGSLKLITINLQSHCNGTKTPPVDAQFNSLSNHMSSIKGIEF